MTALRPAVKFSQLTLTALIPQAGERAGGGAGGLRTLQGGVQSAIPPAMNAMRMRCRQCYNGELELAAWAIEIVAAPLPPPPPPRYTWIR